MAARAHLIDHDGRSDHLEEEHIMSRWLTTGLLTLALHASVGAQQWPNWRGPSASGVSPATNLPVTWSDTQNVAWKSPIRGLGISSPIVWGDLVVVTSQVGSGEA